MLRKRLFLASGGYLLLTALFTFPATLRFTSHYLGLGDLWQHLWNRWWFDRALTELHVSPYWTDLQYFPFGTSLATQSFSELNLLLGMALSRAVGPVAGYNLLIVLAYVLSGTGAYLLVHELSRSRVAAWIGGVAFAFSPFRVSHLMFLHVQSTQWLPFFAWSLLRLSRRPTVGRTIAAGAFFALAGSSSKYFLVFLSLFALLFVGYELARAPRRPQRWRLVVAVALALTLGIALVTPFVWPLVKEATAQGDSLRLGFETTFSADLLSLAVPAEHHPVFERLLAPLYERFNADAREKVNYLGWSLLALAAAAGWRRNRARWRLGFWWLTVGAFAVLSLGPHLQVAGRIFDSWSLPYRWAAELPFVGLARAPARFVVVATLGLAVLAGLGAARLMEGAAKRGVGGRRLACFGPVLLTALILFDLWTWDRVPLTPAFSEPALREPLPGSPHEAVLEIPMPHITDSTPLFHQTLHQRPIIGGYVSREPRDALEFVRRNPFLEMVLEPDLEHTGRIEAAEARNAHHLFSTYDIGWLLLRVAPPSPTVELLSDWLAGLFGPPARKSETMRVFRVDRAVPLTRFLEGIDSREPRRRSPLTAQWYGLDGFKVAIPDGDYRVLLRFAEIYFDQAGRRLFNILVEGRVVERQLDIFARVGKLRPLELAFETRVEDGILDVDFDHILNLAVLNGIAVLRADGRPVFSFFALQDPDRAFDGRFGFIGRPGYHQTRLDPLPPLPR